MTTSNADHYANILVATSQKYAPHKDALTPDAFAAFAADYAPDAPMIEEAIEAFLAVLDAKKTENAIEFVPMRQVVPILLKMAYAEVDHDKRLAVIGAHFRSFVEAWHSLPTPRPIICPITPIVKVWASIPPVIPPDNNPTGLLNGAFKGAPNIIGLTIPERDNTQQALLATGPTQEHAQLTMLNKDNPRIETAMLGFVDAAKLKSMEQGRGAPLYLRNFVERLIDMPRLYRSGGVWRMEYSFEELLDTLYPPTKNGRRAWTSDLANILPRLEQAVDIIHNARINVDGVLWQVINWRGFATREGKPHTIEIEMPPGTPTTGVRINRQALRRLGVQSAPKYRAYIGLSWFWDKYGGRNGRLILAHKDGSINPERTRYPVFDDEDILFLCYADEDVTQQNKRERLRSAKRALTQMAKDGYCVIEQDVIDAKGRRGWRIMPV